MSYLLTLVIHTANILGSFQDPFEFEGDYGPEVNPIRETVFELVVSKETQAKNLADFEIKLLLNNETASEEEILAFRQARVDESKRQDMTYGPKLKELVNKKLLKELSKKQKLLEKSGFSEADLKRVINFIEKYKNKKVFYFFRNAPSDLLALDKPLHDKASREMKPFDLPILGSTELFKGKNSTELKNNLLQQLFNEENLNLSISTFGKFKASLSQLDAKWHDLKAFSTPAGQLIFYWLYQALNLHLISEDNSLIKKINRVKTVFASTLGNSKKRADAFKEKLIKSGTGVLFTQESDAFVPKILLKDGFFLPIDKQNSLDGTNVYLRSDLWQPDYQVIPMEHYDGFAKGRLNVILATTHEGEKFLLASAHGNSTNAEDGRLQITLVMEKFNELVENGGYENLQLIIGIDANTKSEKDVQLLQELLDRLGLTRTHVGPTTIKKRMVTTQHSKAGRFAIDEEDYLIILKPEKGGLYSLANETVGFNEEKVNIHSALPNVNNPSDHYPVGAVLIRNPSGYK